MENDTEAEKAIQELNGATVDGRTIVVNKSEPKPEGERRSFNNNRSGGSGGGYNGGGNSRGGGSYSGGNCGGGNRGRY
jgi:RNA recognition motif-containing protein